MCTSYTAEYVTTCKYMIYLYIVGIEKWESTNYIIHVYISDAV